MPKKQTPRWRQDQLEDAIEDLEEWIDRDERLGHLQIKKRGDALTLASTADDGEQAHARFTLLDRDYWCLSLPNSSGRWEKTPFAGTLREVYDTLIGMLGFHLVER